MMKCLNIVLIAPKIAANTGNIIRLCANTGAILHLVRPLGFDLDDKKLRRAGLDYHEHAAVVVHEDWVAAKSCLPAAGHVCALTTKQGRNFYEQNFTSATDLVLLFGSETCGLPPDVRLDVGVQNWLRLPMLPDSRSLNLSNSVAICVYEVWRQWGFAGDVGKSVGYDVLTC